MGRKRHSTTGVRLRYLREVAGLTTRELDALAGITKGHSTQLENQIVGDRVSARTILSLAKVFGVDPSWLLDGSGPSPTEEDVLAAVRARAPAPPGSGPLPACDEADETGDRAALVDVAAGEIVKASSTGTEG